MSEQIQYLKVPANVANALFKYLNTRPMGEVRVLVNALEKCLSVEPTVPPEPPQEGGEP